MNVEALAKSHQQFKEKYGKKYSQLFKDLVEKGQSPKTLFITCSDSRIVPNLITFSKPGDLFIARNIGNFVPPYNPNSEASATPAVIEYAVSVLGVSNIIVCGHTSCGACKSLHDDIPDNDEMMNINKWLKFGESAKHKAIELVGESDLDALYTATEKFNITEQLKNLLTYPAVKRKVANGDINVFGWYYHLKSGELECFDPVDKCFIALEGVLEK